ncbi:MAG: alkaline phosphatase family protein [Acidobacteriota bacterium]
MKVRIGAVSLLLSGLFAARGVLPQTPDSRPLPRLLLFVIIDQMRDDYLSRFRPLFRYGFKRLLDSGVRFTNAHQNHAVTVTGPGHAALATGQFPGHNGIVDNTWFDRGLNREVYCVEDLESPVLESSSTTGRSPRNLLVGTLADWIKEADPNSQVYSASRKDRGAILPGGHRAGGAFWYDLSDGRFVTSQYYMSDYPEWVRRFQQRNIPGTYFGKLWKPVEVPAEIQKKVGIENIDAGAFRSGFPHAIGSASIVSNARFFTDFAATPFVDSYALDFARALVDNQGLGSDDHLDFLGLSLSALDAVGHGYGPNSPEVLDTLLRLDQALGEFLDFLDRRVGLERVVVMLSADHGVMPLPEYRSGKGLEGHRMGPVDIQCFQQVSRKLESEFGEDDWFLAGLYLKYETIGRRNLLRSRLEEWLAGSIRECPGVAEVWTRSQLESSRSGPFLDLYRNSFHPERSPDLFVQNGRFVLASRGRGTTHGSPYPYDTHVALLFLMPGLPAGTIDGRINTVDVAPTLASLLGIARPDDLDGVDRSQWLRSGGDSRLPSLSSQLPMRADKRLAAEARAVVLESTSSRTTERDAVRAAPSTPHEQ